MSSDRLLLVEDDSTTRDVLTLLLQADGWSVLAVESGEAAREALRVSSIAPASILCDLRLPGLQGAALATSLRQLAPGAVLIAMSASPAETPGYDTCLQKPFAPADLRRAVEHARTRSKPAHATTPVSGGEDATRSKTELPVLSTDTLLKLQQQMGGGARNLYAFALADAGDRLRRMEQSLRDGDDDAFRAEAHALKGSAGMIGALQLAALAAQAESFSPDFTPDSRGEMVGALHLACDALRLMLETLFPI